MLLVLIVFGLVYYFLIYKNSDLTKKTVSCNSDIDVSCKMYNSRDIKSKCSSMCSKENPKYIFTGEYNKKYNEHTCGCEIPKEQFTLDYTDAHETPDILPDTVPDDSKFSNRDYLEKEQENRYNKLIFG
jgi:hypothetical protein